MLPPFFLSFLGSLPPAACIAVTEHRYPFPLLLPREAFDVPGDLRGKRREKRKKKNMEATGQSGCQQIADPMSLWRTA